MFRDVENIGENLLAAGEYNKALKFFEAALEVNSNDVQLYYGKGEALYWLGRYTEALECYQAVLEIDPQHVKALVGKGNVLALCTRQEEPWESIESAINLKGDAASTFDKGKNFICIWL